MRVEVCQLDLECLRAQPHSRFSHPGDILDGFKEERAFLKKGIQMMLTFENGEVPSTNIYPRLPSVARATMGLC